MKRRLTFLAKFFGAGCITIMAILTLSILGLIAFFSFGYSPEYSLNGVRCIEIDNEIEYFQESSEFNIPNNAEVILSCDDHSGFNWDGEYYFVFDTTPQRAASYLEETPWDATWQQGPVPEVIRDNIALTDWADEQFESANIWYLAENNSRPNTSLYERWWNGRILVVNLESGRVYYTKWDF